MVEKLEEIGLIIAIVLAALLGLAAFEYHRLYAATALALQTQNQAIEAQKTEAAKELAQATAEVNTQAENQKAIDDQTIADLQAAATAAASAPVRVRYVSTNAGCGGASPKAGSAGAGAADANASTGVLAPAAQQQFDGAVAAIETLQAAFNSCKATLGGN